MRTKITEVSPLRVRLMYEDAIGAIITREYWIANVHGLPVVRTSNGRMVCDGLFATGNVLTVGSSERLIDVIRREWKIHRRKMILF